MHRRSDSLGNSGRSLDRRQEHDHGRHNRGDNGNRHEHHDSRRREYDDRGNGRHPYNSRQYTDRRSDDHSGSGSGVTGRSSSNSGNRGSGYGYRGNNYNTSRGGQRGGGYNRRPEHEVLSHDRLGQVTDAIPRNIPTKGSTILCNSKDLDLRNARPVYTYNIEVIAIEKKTGKVVPLKEASDNDASKQLKYTAFNEIFRLLKTEYSTFFKTAEVDANGKCPNFYVYDRSCLLYSNLDLLKKGEEREFSIETQQMINECTPYVSKFKTIKLLLKKTGKLEFNYLHNFFARQEPIDSFNLSDSEIQPITQYLEILFNQPALQLKENFYVLGKQLFPANSGKCKDIALKNGCIIKKGIKKNVRLTSTGLKLEIDAIRSPFYPAIDVLDYLDTLNMSSLLDNTDQQSCLKIFKALKGIAVTTTNLNNNRSFKIAQMAGSAQEETFKYKKDDKDPGILYTVVEWYEKIYSITLRNPRCLCIKKGKYTVYPLEVLRILPGQRVPTKLQDNNMTRMCQLSPEELYKQIADICEEAEIHTFGIIKDAGIRINMSDRPQPCQELAKPTVVYEKSILQLKKSRWNQERGCEYVKGAVIKSMAVIIVDSIEQHRVESWMRILIEKARVLGVEIGHYTTENYRRRFGSYDPQNMEHLMKHCLGNNYDYLMFLGDSKELHDAIKFTELKTRIPTQQITIKTVLDSGRKGDTLTNIIHKMNLKAGGQNVRIGTGLDDLKANKNVDIFKSLLKKTVIIGIEMSHPGAKTDYERLFSIEKPELTSVGIAYTHDRNGNMTHGEYFFIPRGTAIIKHEKLAENAKEAVKLFMLNEQQAPCHVLIYRSGIDEGSFAAVAKDECEKVRAALEDIAPNATITMVIIQRRSNHRLFPEAVKKVDLSNPQQKVPNVAPGTCITTKITNLRYKEFIMTPQIGQIGTSKPIVGTVVYETKKNSLTFDQIQHLTHGLCYQFEITTAPVAMPAPLQNAKLLAFRGLNNFLYACNNGLLSNIKLATNKFDKLKEKDKHNEVQKVLDKYYDELKVSITDRRFYA